MPKNGVRPIHPGEILREEYLFHWDCPPMRWRERRGITGDTVLCLARYFGTDAQSWLIVQLA